MRRVRYLSAAFFLCAGLMVAAFMQPASYANWSINGGDGNARFSPLTQINKSNVKSLQVAWTYESGDHFTGSEMQSNPIVIDGVLYATTPTMKVIAVNAATGKEIWRFDPSGGSTARARFRHRGVAVHDDRVFVTYRNFLFALDKKNGQPIASFGAGGKIDLREGLGKPAEGSASAPARLASCSRIS